MASSHSRRLVLRFNWKTVWCGARGTTTGILIMIVNSLWANGEFFFASTTRLAIHSSLFSLLIACLARIIHSLWRKMAIKLWVFDFFARFYPALGTRLPRFGVIKWKFIAGAQRSQLSRGCAGGSESYSRKSLLSRSDITNYVNEHG